MGGYLAIGSDLPNYTPSLSEWHKRYKQQASWTRDVRDYLFSKCNAKKGDRALEIGSGTGAVLSLISDSQPFTAWGIDIDRTALTFSKAILPSSQLVQGDGYHLPFAQNTFAFSFCHYLLLWLQNPVEILKEMGRVCRPGGAVIALAEPDHKSRIDFPPPLDHLGALQTQSLKDQGVDITIGQRLGDLFHQCGFLRIETGVLGAQWKGTSRDENDESEWMTLRSDLAGELSEEEFAHYKTIDEQSRLKGTRILFIPTFYAIGFVK